jgi:hypothetical protein
MSSSFFAPSFESGGGAGLKPAVDRRRLIPPRRQILATETILMAESTVPAR